MWIMFSPRQSCPMKSLWSQFPPEMKNNNKLWEHNNNNHESKALIRNGNFQSLEIYDDLKQMFKSIFNCYTMYTYMIIQ